MKKILIINGHPNPNSYCQSLASAYKIGAVKAGYQVDELILHQLDFNPNLYNGYSTDTPLEKDLVMAQKKIKEAEHIVIVHPVWWGSLPALLKGFIDRVFLPGFAFKYRKDSVMWDKLLSGRTARIIYTLDTPVFIYSWFFNAPSVNQLKRRTLQFCGIKSVKVTAIGPIRKSTQEFRNAALVKVEELGRRGV